MNYAMKFRILWGNARLCLPFPLASLIISDFWLQVCKNLNHGTPKRNAVYCGRSIPDRTAQQNRKKNRKIFCLSSPVFPTKFLDIETNQIKILKLTEFM